MNKNITFETYNYITVTLDKLRDEIMYVGDTDTRISLLEHRDAIQRIISGHSFKPINPTIPPQKLPKDGQ
jgi:hypothetical protein